MNKQESLLLSKSELYAIVRDGMDVEDIAKAQAKHMLEQLEKEGRLKKGHEEWRGLDFHGEWRCKPDCWLCAALREVGA